jgi:hypothetical protein
MKYTPGLLVGQLSGKAGSTVAARNRNGSYIRTRVIPMLVQNAATEAVRASFTQNSQQWRQLTDTQRQGWAALGAGITRNNSLGTSYNLTGIQAYQSVNRNLATIAQDPVSDAPQQTAPDAITGIFHEFWSASSDEETTVTTGAASATQVVGSTANFTVGLPLQFNTSGEIRHVLTITDATHVVLDSTVTTTTGEGITMAPTGWIEMSFTPGPVPADTYFAFFMTPPMSPGISRPTKNAFKLIQVLSPADTSPHDFTAYYNAVAGSPPPGSKIFIQAVAISSTGFRSTPIEDVAPTYRPA